MYSVFVCVYVLACTQVCMYVAVGGWCLVCPLIAAYKLRQVGLLTELCGLF